MIRSWLKSSLGLAVAIMAFACQSNEKGGSTSQGAPVAVVIAETQPPVSPAAEETYPEPEKVEDAPVSEVKSPPKAEPRLTLDLAVIVKVTDGATVTEDGFAADAFPPTLSDTDWHRDAWDVNDCLRCHETGVGDSPEVSHVDMPGILLDAKCRSCHVLIPGSLASDLVLEEDAEFFDDNAFPPMIPNSQMHISAWTIGDCMMCHEDGTSGAPIVRHEHDLMPQLLLKVKCRSCHVQVRSIESDPLIH